MVIPKSAIIYINNKKAPYKEVAKLDREKIKQINIEKEENKVYITTIK